METRLYHPNNYEQPCRNRFWYLQIVCWYHRVWMSKHPIQEWKTNWKKCWNVPVETWHYNSRKKLYYCNRINVPFWNESTEVTWLQSYKISESPQRSYFKLVLLEISSLGFTGSSIKACETYLDGKSLDSVRIIKKCQEVAIRVSYYIYCRRNKKWPDPEKKSYT